jgi:hypothetical protein
MKFENTDSEQALINREIAGTMDPPIWNMCAYCVRKNTSQKPYLGILPHTFHLVKNVA